MSVGREREGPPLSAERVVLRRATPLDVPAAERIVFASLRAFGIEPEPLGGDADIYAFGARATHDDWVATVDGVVSGMVALEPHDEHHGWVSKLFVDASRRGCGVGHALLARAVLSGRERGYTRLGLRTRTVFASAIRLYEATGWQRGEDPPSRGVGEDRTYWLSLA